MELLGIGEPSRSTGAFSFAVNLSAETRPDLGQQKACVVQPNVPGYAAFEMVSDEGRVVGGDDTAPAPLSYLAAGIAFCFLSHVAIYVQGRKLAVASVKLEQKMHFQAAVFHMNDADGEPPKGVCESIETRVIVETREPPEAIHRMMEVCEAACMGLQTAINAVPVDIRLVCREPDGPA